jgi:hypothetical protein
MPFFMLCSKPVCLLREEFQEQGRPPERARVRFSKVLTRGARGWQVLLYHRDIQPLNTG